MPNLDTPALTPAELAGLIDHTYLKAFGDAKVLERLCAEAAAYRFASVAVNGCEVARCAAALRGTGVKVTAVPNPIDVRTFCPGDKVEARRRLGLPLEGRLILFVAQNVSHVNKGMGYLAEACRMLAAGRKEAGERLGVVMLGGCGVELAGSFDVPAYPLGYVTDVEKIVNAYRAADLFVLPSLSENLPNTIMEAMACGVPCVGFNVGGIPEMIDHRKNGYVAAYKSAEDLADGMRWILQEADYDALSRAAVAKVSASYSQQSVALKYIEVYNQAIAYRHYRL